MQNRDNVKSSLHYIVSMQVRDYECDTQGVVNNAVYLNYLEHARNQLFWNKGSSLIDLHTAGEDPVVAYLEIQYLLPLYARENFSVETNIETKGNFKLLFHQKILKVTQEQEAMQQTNIVKDKNNSNNTIRSVLHAKAIVTVAILHKGKPIPIKNTKLYAMLM